MQWVTGSGALTATDTACDATVSNRFDQCVHGGEVRTLPLPGSITSCANLTITDTLGVLQWTCRDVAGVIHATSTAFLAGKGLSDVVDFDAGILRPLAVEVRDGGTLVFTSPSEVLWDNPVIVSTGRAMDTPGTIYVINTSTSQAHGARANSVALLAKPGVTVTLPLNASIVTAGPQAWTFGWVEGSFIMDSNRPNPTGAIFLDPNASQPIRFGTVRNLTLVATGTVSFGFYRPQALRLQGLNVTHPSGINVGVGGFNNNAPSHGVLVEDFVGNGLVFSGLADAVARRITIQGEGQDDGGAFNTNRGPLELGGSYEVTDVVIRHGLVNFQECAGHCRLRRLTMLDGEEITFTGGNTTLQDVLLVGALARGIMLATANNRVVGVTVAGTQSQSLFVNNSQSSNLVRDVTLVGGGHTAGFYPGGILGQSSPRTTFINALVVGSGGSGLDQVTLGDFLTSTFANLVLTDHQRYGAVWTTGNAQHRFTGVMRFANNGLGACEGTAVAGNQQGLAEIAGQQCQNTLSSDAVFTYGTPADGWDAIFRGVQGTPLAYSAITNLLAGPLQGYVPDQTGLPAGNDGRRGRCPATGTCVLYDFSLRTGSLAHNVNAAGSGTMITHRWDTTVHTCAQIPGAVDNAGVCTSSVPVGLVETVDSAGNRNGICEPGEDCLATPNVGSYQGHGNLMGPVMTPVGTGMAAVYTYDTNGY